MNKAFLAASVTLGCMLATSLYAQSAAAPAGSTSGTAVPAPAAPARGAKKATAPDSSKKPDSSAKGTDDGKSKSSTTAPKQPDASPTH